MSQTSVDEHVMTTYRRSPIAIDSGSGCVVYDASGTPYLDLVAGLAVASVGHCHPRVVAAIATQAARLIHVSNLYPTAPQQELARRLAALTGGMQVFFCNSGAESVECALKLARKHGGSRKRAIVAATGGFHGRTFGALSATGQPAKRTAFEPTVPGFRHVEYGDIGALENAVSDDCAAVLLEPIQGEAGVVVPDRDYLVGVRGICDRAGALLILDEVQTGIGRTGRWFAYEHFGVTPDVVCLAKGLGAGLPIGACLARVEVAASFEVGDHASTFGGGPVPCAAATAVLDVIQDEGLLDQTTTTGALIKDRLASVAGVAEVRGIGLLLGVRLREQRARDVVSAALDRGVLVNDVVPDVVRICPPLSLSEEEAIRGAEIVAQAIGEVIP
ncbi:MAG: acetylornithine transaminase [Actinobacteria bacterium]|nr:acetylornithine transaminase [Actinomycetota bacterium]